MKYQGFVICLLACLGPTFLCLMAPTPLSAQVIRKQSNDDILLMNSVLQAYAANYSKLTTLKASITFIIERKGKNDSVAKELSEDQITINGSNFLIEQKDDKGELDYKLLFKNGKYKHSYWPSRVIELHNPDGMPGRFPLDPREIGASEIRQPFIDFLASSLPFLAKSEGEPKTLIQIETVDKGNGPYQKRSFSFSAAAAFLPVRVLLYFPDDSINLDTKIEYQDTPDGKAKLLKTAFRGFYAPGKFFLDGNGSDTWHESATYDLKILEANKDIDDKEFAFDIPKGFAVRDNTGEAETAVRPDDKPKEQTGLRPAIVGLIVLGSIIVALLTMLVVKKIGKQGNAQND